ncbi:MAG: helix-turn-helix transcriptional regulator [Polyangiaceae bacterium]|nr:helix-turn-helix transcriptional regulator [Polyangiaceae bacterium]
MRGTIRGVGAAAVAEAVTEAVTEAAAGAGAEAEAEDSSLPPPSGLRAASFTVGEAEFLVLSYPAAVPALPESLTTTEQAIAAGLLAGLSNREIALSRGVAVRTVANQVASVLRKAGVRSRFELARKYAG